MAKETLKNVLELMKDRSISEIHIKEGDRAIHVVFTPPSYVSPGIPQLMPVAQPMMESKAPVEQGHPVLSPVIGVVYLASAPQEAPYVQIGQKVRAKDTICIVEAMKVMNHICAGIDGVVTEICVENSEVVQFHQVLFRIEKC